MEEIKGQLTASFQTLVEFLKDAGIPESSVQNLRDGFTISCAMDSLTHRNRSMILQNIQVNAGNTCNQTKKTIHALSMVYEYAKCYPYMNAKRLVDILLDAWENFCTLRSTDKAQVKRKYNSIKAGPRADPILLTNLENLLKEAKECCTMSNIHLYKIRVLRTIYSDEAFENV